MGRRTVDFCKRGHEIAAVGRHRNGRCKACNRGDWERYRSSKGARVKTKDALDYIYLSAAPLRAHLALFPLSEMQRKEVQDILAERSAKVSMGRADAISCGILGLPPALVWGDEWWEAG